MPANLTCTTEGATATITAAPLDGGRALPPVVGGGALAGLLLVAARRRRKTWIAIVFAFSCGGDDYNPYRMDAGSPTPPQVVVNVVFTASAPSTGATASATLMLHAPSSLTPP